MLSLLLTIATFVRPLLHTNHHGTARRSCLVRAVSEPIYEVSDPLCPEDGERDGCGVPAEESVIAEYTPRLLKADETTAMLNDLQLNARTPLDTPPRGVFCTRSLDLKDIKCIGYDMDYTLVHYHVALWEERAYAYIRDGLVRQGWPVSDLVFDPDLVVQGLVVDTEKGNVVKANRFGYVKRAFHGTRSLPYAEQRKTYRRTLVDLHDRRWRFMNTLFSISEASIYLQLVDKLDEGVLPTGLGYDDLYEAIRKTLDAAHLEGLLKAEILADPDRFVERDPDIPLTLLDQKNAGKKVLLWFYPRASTGG